MCCCFFFLLFCFFLFFFFLFCFLLLFFFFFFPFIGNMLHDHIIIKKGKVVFMTSPELRLCCCWSAYLDIEKNFKAQITFYVSGPRASGPFGEGCKGCIRTAFTCPNISESQFFTRNQTQSHLSAYVVNRLFRESRKTIPKLLSG